MTDAKLPTLDLALDATRMRAVLAEACLPTGGRYEARDCRIEHVRHKPGRSCLIGYELLVFDRWQDTVVRQLLCGRVYGTADSESRWRKALDQPLTPTAVARPLTHLADEAMVVWAFPNERKLGGIGALLDERHLAGSVLPAVLGRAVTAVESQLVRYIPEHGCTFRVKADETVLFAKAYPDDTGERTWQHMQELWSRPRRELVLARPVAYQAASRTLWQEAVPGQVAFEPAACGRALAELHAMKMDGLPVASDARQDLQAAVQRLTAAGFASAQLLELASELDRRLPVAFEPATLHGDLHGKNFLVDQGRAALIDLDTLTAGDARRDLGSLLASLPGGSAQKAEFLEAYGHPLGDRDIATYTAWALIVERASRAVSRRKAEPLTAVPALLNAAEQLLVNTATARDWMKRLAARVESVPGVRLDVHYKTYRKAKSWARSTATVAYQQGPAIHVRRFGGDEAAWTFPQDPAVPWLAEALDGERVKRHLPVPADRVTVEVLNYRPENRCTTRYEVEAQGTRRRIYGKTYSDDRGWHVSERLSTLWQIHGAAFPMPTPLGYTPQIHTAWQAEFEGSCLYDRIDDAAAAGLLRAAGQRLMFLHRSRLNCPRRASLAEQWSELSKKSAKLAAVTPELAARLEAALQELERRMYQWKPTEPGVVHGDFHSRQLMVRGDVVALFDFDEIGHGDTLEDFGHFAADLASAGRDPHAYLRHVLEGYGEPVAAEGVAWHTAVQLVTRAYRGLLQLRPDMEVRAARLLALAEESLA